MKNPTISIITVVFNRALDLSTTIQSVRDQTDRSFEYIVVDGGSTDGTLDVARSNDNVIDLLLNGPDKGIYDAMNKGIAASTGGWIIFMNAGDRFYSEDSIKIIQENILHANKKDIKLLCGGAFFFSTISDFCFTKIPSTVDLKSLVMSMPVCHQSMIFKRDAFQLFGNFDTRYRIAADQEWLARFLKGKEPVQIISALISAVEIDGLSGVRGVQLAYERFAIARLHNLPVSRVVLYCKLYTRVLKSQALAYARKAGILESYRKFKKKFRKVV